MTKRPVVIDCDPGVDDTLAICLAASRPELDIRAINPVAGNVGYESTSQNALRLADLLGIDCRVGRGATEPLIAPCRTAGAIHGQGGLGGYQLPEAHRDFDPDYAWDVLAQEARRAGGELEVVALGPMTNLAIALTRYPELKKLIRKITVMAGTAGQGNTNVYAEFNAWVDPHACEIVFQSGIPIAMCGLDGNDTCCMNGEEISEIFDRPCRISDVVRHVAHFIHDRNTIQWHMTGSTIHDLVTMACFVDPSIAVYEPCYTTCETRSSVSFGQTVVDLYHVSGKKPNVDVLRSADKARFLDLLRGMMSWYTEH
ncbi:MAG TPA: nucleoside hydrolase [Candidatus Pygmaiobacter gallistercoris]|nr:nucleoside hydrolase [Candidatus Pygmaiobacter gallistercoris]